MQRDLQCRLDKADSVCITTDMWTSINSTAFIAMTVHFWSEENQSLVSAVLQCTRFIGSHTAEQISQELDKAFTEKEVRHKVLAVVTDNAANVTKAVSHLPLRHLGCYAHSLNLVIMQAITSTTHLTALRDRISELIKLCKTSTLVGDKFKELQGSLGINPPKKLVQDVPTRWNSLYQMLERALKLKQAITLLLVQPVVGGRIEPFTGEDWRSMEEAVSVLWPCYQATIELSGEKFCTGSKVIPLTKMLLGFYAAEERRNPDDSLKKKLASSILQNLLKRFDKVEDIRILAQATLLDPRFKNKVFRQEDKKKNALATLNKELKEAYEKTRPTNEPPAHDETEPPAKMSVLWASFDKDVRNQRLTGVVSDISDIDLRNYLALKLEDRTSDPFQWWIREGKQRYPLLYKLAVKYLSIPATSVPSKRVFSTAGQVLSERRNRLSDKNAHMLICLHANLK